MNRANYKTTFENRGDYAYVLIRAEKEVLDEALVLWESIAECCRDQGLAKLLVDEDVDTSFSTTEMYEFTSRLSQIGFIGLKIAFLDRKLDQKVENEFGELVARNRGINGKFFHESDSAISWLLSDD